MGLRASFSLRRSRSKMVGAAAAASATPPPLPSTSLLLPQATQAGGEGRGRNAAAHVTVDQRARDARRRAQRSLGFVGNRVREAVRWARSGDSRTTFPRRQRAEAVAVVVGERGRGARCRAGVRFGPVVPLRDCCCSRFGGSR